MLEMKILIQMPLHSPDLSSRSQHDDVPNAFMSPVSTDEPMYEGEECVNVAVAPVCADKEPVYEGESLLGKRTEKNVGDCSSEGRATDGLTAEEGKLYSWDMRAIVHRDTPNALIHIFPFKLLIYYVKFLQVN